MVIILLNKSYNFVVWDCLILFVLFWMCFFNVVKIGLLIVCLIEMFFEYRWLYNLFVLFKMGFVFLKLFLILLYWFILNICLLSVYCIVVFKSIIVWIVWEIVFLFNIWLIVFGVYMSFSIFLSLEFDIILLMLLIKFIFVWKVFWCMIMLLYFLLFVIIIVF